MNTIINRHTAIIYLILIFAFSGSVIAPLYAHGPNGHGLVKFTSLSALKKGTQLFDKLIAAGKLDQSWETKLSMVQVVQNGEEVKVKFSKSQGKPRSVVIYFSDEGEYSGSDFSDN